MRVRRRRRRRRTRRRTASPGKPDARTRRSPGAVEQPVETAPEEVHGRPVRTCGSSDRTNARRATAAASRGSSLTHAASSSRRWADVSAAVVRSSLQRHPFPPGTSLRTAVHVASLEVVAIANMPLRQRAGCETTSRASYGPAASGSAFRTSLLALALPGADRPGQRSSSRGSRRASQDVRR
jgi:hypothetical protein